MTDIVNCKFSTTVNNQYVTALKEGFQLSARYSNSDACITSTVSILDGVNGFNVNLTDANAQNSDESWNSPVFNMTNIVARDVNGGVYNCYLFTTGVIETVDIWQASFVDDTDISLSFLFNMLGNGLQFRDAIIKIE